MVKAQNYQLKLGTREVVFLSPNSFVKGSWEKLPRIVTRICDFHEAASLERGWKDIDVDLRPNSRQATHGHSYEICDILRSLI